MEKHPSFSCTDEDYSELPEISYVINGVEYVLPSHKWMKRTIDDRNERGGNCEASIHGLDFSYDGLGDMFLLGDNFM